MVRFSCPTCGQHFTGDESYYGRQLNCPACRNTFVVPSPAASAPPPLPHYPPDMLPPKKGNPALMIVVGVLSFLLASGAGFFVVQRILAPKVVEVASAPKKVVAQAKSQLAKVPKRSDEGDGSAQLGAPEIIQRVSDAYGALTSFTCDGSVVTDMDMSQVDLASIPGMPQAVAAKAKASKEAKAALAKPQHMEADFSVKLSKPNFYRIDWKSQQGLMKASGAAWSAGDGDYLFMGMTPPKYVKLESRDMALGAAAGVSQGAAHTIPALFFAGSKNILESMQNAALDKEESVDGSDCYQITGDLQGMKIRLWVAKANFLVKQRRQVLGGQMKIPEMSDKDVDAALKQLGGGATAAKREQMKTMMQNMRAMTSKMKGTVTETYRNIETNQKIAADKFKYEVPPGVELSKSLF